MSQTRWLCLALIVTTLACFGHVFFCDFIHLDDPAYITRNPFVLNGLTWTDIKWAFTDSCYRAGYWAPLTWLSLQTDATLFGPNGTGGFHLTNLVWHVVNVVLFFLVLQRMTGDVWRSFVAAALFAIHPLRVESVAWVTERKDMVSATFLILTVGAYHRYAENPSWRRYSLVVLAYALGLMAKPTLVTLPFALLLLDYWPLYRLRLGQNLPPTLAAKAGVSIGRLVLEKLPLIAMALGISWLTMHFSSQSGAITPQIPWSHRLSLVVSAYVTYVEKTFWPTNLAVLYPHYVPSPARVALAAIILIAITSALIYRARQCPALIVGWLWFLGMLVPNIGFVQAGPQAFADRFTYLPHLGLMIAIVWGGGDWSAWQKATPFIRKAVVGLVLAILGMLTWIQVWYWSNSETLFVHSLRVVGDNYHLHLNLSLFWLERDDLEMAEYHVAKSVDADPTDVVGRLAYASLLWRRAKYAAAGAESERYLQTFPDNPDAHYYLGRVHTSLGRLAEGRRHLEKAVANWPPRPVEDYYLGDMDVRKAAAHQVLGEIALREGRPEEALNQLDRAAAIKPELAEGQHFFAGIALGRLNRWPDAEKRFVTAAQRDPTNEACRGYLAFALARQGKKDAVEWEYAAVRSKFPDWLKNTNDAAIRLITKARWLDRKTAEELATQTCEATDFKDARALDALAAVQAATGDFAKARETAANALKLAPDLPLTRQLEERLRLYERNQALPVDKD